MTRRFVLAMCFAVFAALGARGARSQSEQIVSQKAEIVPGQWSVQSARAEARELMANLALDAAEAYAMALTPIAPAPLKLALLELGLHRDPATGALITAEEAGSGATPLVGVTTSVELGVSIVAEELAEVGARAEPAARGVARRLRDGSLAWTVALESPGARAMRLKLEGLALPRGVTIHVYGIEGESNDAHGPYTGAGVLGGGVMWTHTIFGSAIFLEVRIAPGVLFDSIEFTIAEAAHMGGPNFFGGRADPQGEFNFDCLVDAQCPEAQNDWPMLDAASDAIGNFFFMQDGDFFSCTGSLVNDLDQAGFIPYFLTANHCIDTQEAADTMEVFFKDVRETCNGGNPPIETLPSVLGAELLAHKSLAKGSDFSLLRLNPLPAGGAPYTFLGWTTAAPAVGSALYRISHPSSDPQHYSRHIVIERRFDCDIPHRKYVHSINVIGATRGGSSGSAIMNFDMQILGQLLGACGPDPDNVCDNAAGDTLDGSFAKSFKLAKPFIGVAPELQVKRITLDPPKPRPGEAVTATVKIKNKSRKSTAANFIVSLWTNLGEKPGCGQPGAAGSQTIATLGPLQARELTFTFDAPSAAGKFFAYAMVDAGCTTTEKNENNNAKRKKYRVRQPE